MATGDDRDALKSLAQIGAVWGLIDAGKTQPIVDKMINLLPIQKEVADRQRRRTESTRGSIGI